MKRIISLILILIGLSGVSAEAQNFFSQDDDNQVMNDGPKVWRYDGHFFTSVRCLLLF